MIGLARRQSLLHVGLTGAAVWAPQLFCQQKTTSSLPSFKRLLLTLTGSLDLWFGDLTVSGVVFS
jgi:hypothetical protein